ncbi:MAG: PrsW family glutamic-type intramembrane protease [Verrucomicrobiales bacterium]|nr:PrsW family glutamic-type intramembrane protease [Verrucomicrobiales bacterium]
MPPLKPHRLARLSRDREFLIKASIIISVTSIIVAFVVSLFSPSKPNLEKEMAALREIINDDSGKALPKTFESWVFFIRTGISMESPQTLRDCRNIKLKIEGDAGEPIEPEGISDGEAEMLHSLDLGLRLSDPDSAVRRLRALPESLKFRNEFLGDIEFTREHYPAAQEHYLNAATLQPDSSYNRRSAVISAWRSGDKLALRKLLHDPLLRDEFALSEQLDLFTDARDFKGLAVAVMRYEIAEFISPSLVPALFTGAIWFLILMPFWQINPQRLLFSILAVAAGIISAGLTIYAVMIQERMQGFTQNLADPPLIQVVYYVAGVALREETLKLLCFLPFAIWAALRGKYLDGLILAALVGLGFAFKENILYFENGLTSFTAWMRFLTANVLHFSLTGIAGFYLVRMLHRKFHGLESFLFSFIAVVIAHGLYNSVIAVPELISYSPLSTIFVAAMAYQFFDPLRSQMETQGIANRISPLGVFVLGSAFLACFLMIASAWITPFRFALGVFASGVAGLIPLAFAYISRFRDL